MKEYLMKKWSIKATTLYDRPPKHFDCVDVKSRHELFLKLAETYDAFKVQGKQVRWLHGITNVANEKKLVDSLY